MGGVAVIPEVLLRDKRYDDTGEAVGEMWRMGDTIG